MRIICAYGLGSVYHWLRNLEYFVIMLKLVECPGHPQHMVEDMGENWQGPSFPTQFNWLRQGNFVGRGLLTICRSLLAPLCLAERKSSWKRSKACNFCLSSVKRVQANDLQGTHPFTLVNMQQIYKKEKLKGGRISPPAATRIPGGCRLTNRCPTSLCWKRNDLRKQKRPKFEDKKKILWIPQKGPSRFD